MKIDSIDIEEFANGEHRGKTVEAIGGDPLLFQGGSRTGKTLTFNAILYNLLGARNTVDLATGRQNEVELGFTDGTRFFRGNPEAEYENGGETLTGANASETFKEKIGDTPLIKSHFVHSHLGKMPLDDLSRSKRISLIRTVTNEELRQRIARFERAEDQLNQLVIETKDENRRVSEDLKDVERTIDDLESQQEKYENIREKIDSGELEEISDQLQRDEELENHLDQLFREKEGLRKRLRKLHRKKRKQENYDSEVKEIIAEAVNDFVCPTCDRRITTEKAKNRIDTGNCPYCGRNHSLEDLKQSISERIDHSDDLLEDLEAEIEELQEQRQEVTEDIEQLRDEQPEIGDLNGFVKRRLDDYNHDIQTVQQHTQEELENISESLSEARAKKEELAERKERTEERLDAYTDALDTASEKVEELTEESLEAGIQEFSDAWEDAYNEMNSNLELEISINEEGRIQFPGRNNLREYDRGGNLSGSELHLLNISFVCTLSQFATENEVIDWDTIVLDEPFSNLQEDDNKEAALEYLTGLDKQLIATTSDDSLGTWFDNVEVLEREPLQTTLGEFL
jgi:DNA repair exonuclease SbcCD ATPase subunit